MRRAYSSRAELPRSASSGASQRGCAASARPMEPGHVATRERGRSAFRRARV